MTGATDATNGPQTGTGGLDAIALAADAVGTAVNQAGAWLPVSVRQAVAKAVLAAIEPVTEHCIHSADMHQRYHQPANPIPGCPWCSGGGTADTVQLPTDQPQPPAA